MEKTILNKRIECSHVKKELWECLLPDGVCNSTPTLSSFDEFASSFL